MGAASPGGMTTTLLAVVVLVLALLLLRLIGRVVGLVLRLALLALLAALLLLAFAPRHPDPGLHGPGRRAPRPSLTDDASTWLPESRRRLPAGRQGALRLLLSNFS